MSGGSLPEIEFADQSKYRNQKLVDTGYELASLGSHGIVFAKEQQLAYHALNAWNNSHWSLQLPHTIDAIGTVALTDRPVRGDNWCGM